MMIRLRSTGPVKHFFRQESFDLISMFSRNIDDFDMTALRVPAVKVIYVPTEHADEVKACSVGT